MYDFIQSALTVSIQVVALAGFGGIAAHAMWKQHARIAAIYAEVPHATPDTQAEVEEVSALVEPAPEPVEDIAAPVEPATEPATELHPVIPETIIDDPWSQPITTSGRRWVQQCQPSKPVLALPPAKHPTPTFEGYSPARLKKIAKSLLIKRYSVMQPQELMVAITQHPAAAKYLTA